MAVTFSSLRINGLCGNWTSTAKVARAASNALSCYALYPFTDWKHVAAMPIVTILMAPLITIPELPTMPHPLCTNDLIVTSVRWLTSSHSWYSGSECGCNAGVFGGVDLAAQKVCAIGKHSDRLASSASNIGILVTVGMAVYSDSNYYLLHFC